MTIALEKPVPMQTQWICTSKPFCLCVGHPNEWDECCCMERSRKCENCGAPMELIDFATGRPARS